MRRLCNKAGYSVLETKAKVPHTVVFCGNDAAVKSMATLILLSFDRKTRKNRYIFCPGDFDGLICERESESLTVIELADTECTEVAVGAIACGAAKTVFRHGDGHAITAAVEDALKRIDLSRTPTTVKRFDGGVEVCVLYYDDDAFERTVMEFANATAPFCAMVEVEYNYPPVFAAYDSLDKALSLDGNAKVIEKTDFSRRIWLPLKGKTNFFIRVDAKPFDFVED